MYCFVHFKLLLFSCMRYCFEQNTRKLIVYLRSLSDNSHFLYLFFIFGDTFLDAHNIIYNIIYNIYICYNFASKFLYTMKKLNMHYKHQYIIYPSASVTTKLLWWEPEGDIVFMITYVLCSSPWHLSTLCVVDHSWPHTVIYGFYNFC